MKSKITNVSYSSETPDETLLWLHQLIITILIRELKLDPWDAGNLIQNANQYIKLIKSIER